MHTRSFVLLLTVGVIVTGAACTNNPLGPGPIRGLPDPGVVPVPEPPPDSPTVEGNMTGGGTLAATYQHFQGYSAITATVTDRTGLGSEVLTVQLYRTEGDALLQEIDVQLDDDGDADAGFFIDRLGKYTVKVTSRDGNVVGTVTINVV